MWLLGVLGAPATSRRPLSLKNIFFVKMAERASVVDIVDKIRFKLYQCPGYVTASNGACHLYQGTKKCDMYHYIDYVNAEGKRKQSSAHRLSYFAHYQNQVPPPDCKLDVSHLCHNKSCINPGHLVLEPHSTNCKRRLCHHEKRCHENHQGGPLCMVHLILD